MSRIALISDIHSNLHALDAVLLELEKEGVERIVCCGDVVGYGPHPAECVRRVRELGCEMVMGNHEHYTLLAKREPERFPTLDASLGHPVLHGIHFSARALDEGALDWLGKLPMTLEIPGAIVAHAALHDFTAWPYLRSEDEALPTLRILAEHGRAVGFFGHTHRQEWFHLPGSPPPEPAAANSWTIGDGGTVAVVAGSVGQPRCGGPDAAWTLWEPETRTFTFRRTPYDFHRTAKELVEAGLPASSGRRLLG